MPDTVKWFISIILFILHNSMMEGPIIFYSYFANMETEAREDMEGVQSQRSQKGQIQKWKSSCHVPGAILLYTEQHHFT